MTASTQGMSLKILKGFELTAPCASGKTTNPLSCLSCNFPIVFAKVWTHNTQRTHGKSFYPMSFQGDTNLLECWLIALCQVISKKSFEGWKVTTLCTPGKAFNPLSGSGIQLCCCVSKFEDSASVKKKKSWRVWAPNAQCTDRAPWTYLSLSKLCNLEF